MKREDKEIKYRPELAEQLNKYLDTALEFYDINYQKVYYLMFAKIYENDGLAEKAEYLKQVARCFDSPFPAEEFFEEYAEELKKEYCLEYVSPARAASFVFGVYRPIFEDFEKSVAVSGLTKMERHMVHDFFLKLMVPMRNPNIEIKEGQLKCWYDENPGHSFLRDLKQSLGYVKKNCQSTIEIFSTPDEELEEEQSKEER